MRKRVNRLVDREKIKDPATLGGETGSFGETQFDIYFGDYFNFDLVPGLLSKSA